MRSGESCRRWSLSINSDLRIHGQRDLLPALIMKPAFFSLFVTVASSPWITPTLSLHGAESVTEVRELAERWRTERRTIDLHQHIDYTPEHLGRAVRVMDRAGIGIGVNLSGGTTTREEAKPSQFEQNKKLADELFPGRFIHYMNPDYKAWDEPDFSARAVKQVEEGHRFGAAGLKEYKRL